MTLDILVGRLAEAAEADGADWSLKLEIAHETMWSAELRWTAEPMREDGPDRSTVFYSVGGATPSGVAEAAWRDFLAWRRGD